MCMRKHVCHNNLQSCFNLMKMLLQETFYTRDTDSGRNGHGLPTLMSFANFFYSTEYEHAQQVVTNFVQAHDLDLRVPVVPLYKSISAARAGGWRMPQHPCHICYGNPTPSSHLKQSSTGRFPSCSTYSTAESKPPIIFPQCAYNKFSDEDACFTYI